MLESLHKILLWIHIPFGFLSLVLFWIPITVKKGGDLHRKVGKWYYYSMWIVLISSALLSICNTFLGRYLAALYLGFLTVITSYPLWYSYEILNQNKEWTSRYFRIRKFFVSIIFITSIGMFLMGSVKFKFQGMGPMMCFFGLIGIPTGRDIFMSFEKAMKVETKLSMHIQGTIISGIAAYTAFFAFGGSRILMNVLHLNQRWMILPWILPTVLGVIYMRYMKKKYRV